MERFKREARVAAGMTMAEAAKAAFQKEDGWFWCWSELENGYGEPATFREGMAICRLLGIEHEQLANEILGRKVKA